MPENESHVGAFYDHETEEPRATGRRRRQVADWGVGEDVFDRMPSRRFARADRRGADTHDPHHTPRESRARDEVADWSPRDDADWGEDGRTRRFAPASDSPLRHELEEGERRPAAGEPTRRRRRPAADWLAEVTPPPAPEADEEFETPADTDGPRTIALGGAVEGEDAPKPRRTVVIGGHPDKLPAPRPRRPPRTAVERLGASPDRIMAYAVGLGLLLILIAVLTTSH